LEESLKSAGATATSWGRRVPQQRETGDQVLSSAQLIYNPNL